LSHKASPCVAAERTVASPGPINRLLFPRHLSSLSSTIDRGFDENKPGVSEVTCSSPGVDRLPGDVARGGAAQEPHHRRDVLRIAAFARDRAMGQMVRRFRPVLRPRRADQAGDHAIDGDAVGCEIMRQRAGEADDARLRLSRSETRRRTLGMSACPHFSTTSVAGDLPRFSRAIRTAPREAARMRRACGIRTRRRAARASSCVSPPV
jgi:hypothetical protein